MQKAFLFIFLFKLNDHLWPVLKIFEYTHFSEKKFNFIILVFYYLPLIFYSLRSGYCLYRLYFAALEYSAANFVRKIQLKLYLFLTEFYLHIFSLQVWIFTPLPIFLNSIGLIFIFLYFYFTIVTV